MQSIIQQTLYYSSVSTTLPALSSISLAATILVLVGVGYGITNMEEDMRPPTPQDTFSDPEAAYKALQATLIEVSANLNKGIEQIEETRIDVTKVNQEVRKEIQQ